MALYIHVYNLRHMQTQIVTEPVSNVDMAGIELVHPKIAELNTSVLSCLH